MKNVKMMIPEGKAKEAHEYMRSLGYEYTTNRKGQTIEIATQLMGSHDGEMTCYKGGFNGFFEMNDAEEIFLPGHEPVDKSMIDMDRFTEGRLRKDCQDMSFKPSLWHLHFLFDLLDKERNK